jgi:hypothetical protein
MKNRLARNDNSMSSLTSDSWTSDGGDVTGSSYDEDSSEGSWATESYGVFSRYVYHFAVVRGPSSDLSTPPPLVHAATGDALDNNNNDHDGDDDADGGERPRRLRGKRGHLHRSSGSRLDVSGGSSLSPDSPPTKVEGGDDESDKSASPDPSPQPSPQTSRRGGGKRSEDAGDHGKASSRSKKGGRYGAAPGRRKAKRAPKMDLSRTVLTREVGGVLAIPVITSTFDCDDDVLLARLHRELFLPADSSSLAILAWVDETEIGTELHSLIMVAFYPALGPEASLLGHEGGRWRWTPAREIAEGPLSLNLPRDFRETAADILGGRALEKIMGVKALLPWQHIPWLDAAATFLQGVFGPGTMPKIVAVTALYTLVRAVGGSSSGLLCISNPFAGPGRAGELVASLAAASCPHLPAGVALAPMPSTFTCADFGSDQLISLPSLRGWEVALGALAELQKAAIREVADSLIDGGLAPDHSPVVLGELWADLINDPDFRQELLDLDDDDPEGKRGRGEDEEGDEDGLGSEPGAEGTELLERLDASVVSVQRAADTLADSGVPCSVDHCFMTAREIAVREAEGSFAISFFDWAPVTVSHPFFTATSLVDELPDGVRTSAHASGITQPDDLREHLLSLYLEAWTTVSLDLDDLKIILDLAQDLQAVQRAIVFWRLSRTEPSETNEWIEATIEAVRTAADTFGHAKPFSNFLNSSQRPSITGMVK